MYFSDAGLSARSNLTNTVIIVTDITEVTNADHMAHIRKLERKITIDSLIQCDLSDLSFATLY